VAGVLQGGGEWDRDGEGVGGKVNIYDVITFYCLKDYIRIFLLVDCFRKLELKYFH
jgi:hypothetical protein